MVDVLEQAGDRLDLIMIPKVGTAADVYAVDMLVTQIETAKGRKKRIGLELIIETALGMAEHPRDRARQPRALESLHFGVADYAASTRARTTGIGGANPDYAVLTDKAEDGARDIHWGDMWHYAIARMVVAARANGLRPIDGPFGDFSDADGFRAQARRAAVLGCEGKWAIHPTQVALANEVFTPPAKEVDRARRILAAMEQAAKAGQGRREPRRPPDRHRLDPPGRGPGRDRRPDRCGRLSRHAPVTCLRCGPLVSCGGRNGAPA